MANTPWFTYKEYLQQRFGTVLHRVPLDAGFTCPHRRGDGSGGCTFCPPDGARAAQLGSAQTLEEQIDKGVKFARRRYHAEAFMAYLQAFTTTFRSRKELRTLVKHITACQHFEAIAFGLRPDCLPQRVIEWLVELQSEGNFAISAELGVQTSHDATLKRINRGHDWACSRDAILRLAEAGIDVTAHLIIGLPGESREQWLATIDRLTALPLTALKLHNLHLIKKTEMARQWQQEPFPLLDEHQYIEELLAILPRIPPNLPLLRLTTDTPREKLLAPLWSMGKGQFTRALTRQLAARGLAQGSALRRESPAAITAGGKSVVTGDGSLTFYNDQVGEHYHTPVGARAEALHKYVEPGKLEQRLKEKQKAGPVRLLDICFGLGYNSLLACETALACGAELEITALEMDLTVIRRAAAELNGVSPLLEWPQVLTALVDEGEWRGDGLHLTLLAGDARHSVRRLHEAAFPPADLIWLDAFSTQKNSELWTVDFFNLLLPLLAAEGALLTYCAAIPVRAAMVQAGFAVGETAPFGRQRGGTIASHPGSRCAAEALELNQRDQFLITTLRGIPYRDPAGVRTNKEILRAREEEIRSRKAEQNHSMV